MGNTRPAYCAASNENLFGTSPKVMEALQQALFQINSYPHPDAAPLRTVLASKLGIRPSEILVGSGSAELISLLVRRFCSPSRVESVLSLSPSYPLYRQEAQALHVPFRIAPLTSAYEVDVHSLLSKVDDSTRLCFLCNPNNPTGTYLPMSELEYLLRKLPPHVILVVDEAYIEYVTAPDYGDALALLPQFPNLVILRTFSKAYGLASLRIGYMIAQEGVIEKVLQVKQPYNVNQLAQVAALAALADGHFLNQTLAATRCGKFKLEQALQRLGVQYWPSQSNFLLLDAGIKAEVIDRHLLEHQIQSRRTEDSFSLRITVGPDENQLYLIAMLENILHPTALYPQQPLLAQVLATGNSLQHDTADASEKINELITAASGLHNAADRVALAFARALAARNQQTTLHAGNLYNSTYGVMDMISAFNVLVNATPLVSFGHRFANQIILSAIAGANKVYLLDLGIGSGLQWFHLLEQLAKLPGGSPSLHLTGIDIPDSAEEPARRLQETGIRLEEHARRLGIPFSYEGIASRLEDFDLSTLRIAPEQALVINSALTLHHIPDQLVAQPDERDKVLRQIRALKPLVFTLTEPDSEHNKLDYLPRLRESLRHYHTVFDVLDTLLPQDMPERQIIEQEFFGREIINVVASEGADRVERHERSDAWQRRLVRNGFGPIAHPDLAQDLTDELRLHPDFSLVQNGAGYTLHWKGTSIIASTAWRAEA
ncbi:histidinol-phosphate transaminase [Pontibacter sp. JH31]|uniref:histidinol-phosphate transaminase n=1 Tax=Pontibacter aquaedesilientis TaxID=2766980 RepID=A0ABR7XFC6_9BACT|nr:histidinol-phosphate transaminase [Pontibacter aquaedesilientis]MBD1396995.1 histidinol-phosphate transaminase [Pontibacter aquaedesilientis]